MRLIHVKSLTLHEFDADVPAYAVASHRWTKNEVSLQEFRASSFLAENSSEEGCIKIRSFCAAVVTLNSTLRHFNVEYLWIDTCCIDKTNSVELQEALNSMFRWYAEAEVCLAYLSDVGSLDENPDLLSTQLYESEWFRRGWTLQELLAPAMVLFYNQCWEILGRKHAKNPRPWPSARISGLMPLNRLLAKITNIPVEVLWDFAGKVETYSTEQRQLWMKNRKTTRKEDMVYCQLGIFGVFMPLIYGEGDHAMYRLEEAINQKTRRHNASRPAMNTPATAPIYTMKEAAPAYIAKEATPAFTTKETKATWIRVDFRTINIFRIHSLGFPLPGNLNQWTWGIFWPVLLPLLSERILKMDADGQTFLKFTPDTWSADWKQGTELSGTIGPDTLITTLMNKKILHGMGLSIALS